MNTFKTLRKDLIMTTPKNKLKVLLGSVLKDFETAINAVDEATYIMDDVMAELEYSEDLEKIDDMLGDGHFDTLSDIQVNLQNAQHTMNTYFSILNDK